MRPNPPARLERALARASKSWPSLIAGAASIVLILALAWDNGGYFPASYTRAGAVAFGLLALVLAVRPPHYTISTQALFGIAALAGLAAWTGLSAAWSESPNGALDDFQRTLAYVAVFGLGLVAAGSGRHARHLVWAVLAVMVVVGGAGLVSRLYPDLLGGSGAPDDLAGYRLAYPLEYWNAYGALTAMAIVLAVGLAATARTRPLARAAAAAVSVPLVAALYMSLSRGAWAALVIGLIVLVVLGARRWALLWTFLITGAAGALAVILLQPHPALIDDPAAEAGQAAAGQAYGPQLLALAVVAGAAQWVVARARRSQELMGAMGQVLRPLLIGAAGAAVLAVFVLYLFNSAAVDRHSAGAVDSGRDFAGRQWDEFLRPATFSEGGRARLGSARGTRSDLYRVAFDGFEANPLTGDGSAAYESRFMRERRVPEKVRDAHSLYLETLGELGLVGVVLLLMFIGSLAAAAIRSRVHSGGMERAQVAAVAGACAVWVAHAAVDWDWQMPALTATMLLLAATLYPYGRRPDSRMRRWWLRPGRRHRGSVRRSGPAGEAGSAT